MKLLSCLNKILNEMPVNCIPALKFMLGTKEGRQLTFYRPSIMVIGYLATLIVMGRVYAVTQSIVICLLTALIMVGLIAWVSDEVNLPSGNKG